MDAAGLTPQSRFDKLKGLMAANERQPYGKSNNALSVEVGVHLNTILDFVKTKGSPAKFDATTGQYTSEHLKRLAAWIDEQNEPVTPRSLPCCRCTGSVCDDGARTRSPLLLLNPRDCVCSCRRCRRMRALGRRVRRWRWWPRERVRHPSTPGSRPSTRSYSSTPTASSGQPTSRRFPERTGVSSMRGAPHCVPGSGCSVRGTLPACRWSSSRRWG